jgi:hypothetical protein
MARVEYTTTKFVKPEPITEMQFWAIKKELNQNPNLDFEPERESFTERFSGILKMMGISFGIALFCFGLFEDGNPMIAVGGISMIMFFVSIIYLFLEAPSYATYSREKRNFFAKMKTAIQESDNYDEFVNQFYIR